MFIRAKRLESNGKKDIRIVRIGRHTKFCKVVNLYAIKEKQTDGKVTNVQFNKNNFVFEAFFFIYIKT